MRWAPKKSINLGVSFFGTLPPGVGFLLVCLLVSFKTQHVVPSKKRHPRVAPELLGSYGMEFKHHTVDGRNPAPL